jgi:hypothetical protein
MSLNSGYKNETVERHIFFIFIPTAEALQSDTPCKYQRDCFKQ